MGVGVVRIQQGFDSKLANEDETTHTAQSPEMRLKRNQSYSQMSQG